jgi:mono/diheme cytochrome c family protein
MRSTWRSTSALAALLFGAVSWAAMAQAGRTAADRVYTEEQAQRGQALYAAQCAPCHGPALAGAAGPPLTGAAFLRTWDRRPLIDLVDKIQNTMPATNPGTISRAQATDLVAHVLKTNAFPAGSAELSGDAVLKQIAVVGPGAGPGGAPPVAPGPGAAALAITSARPPGNMAQLMRGILFPSSNLLFQVQTYDPAAPKTAYEPGTTSFSWADWGAGIYSGWELVDYAAIAIAESAPLLLAPDRRCENGKPVPVDRADWIQFTADLAEAGRAAYRASQTRNRETVSDVTNQIADACLRCHEVYRDKGRGTPDDPSNKAARC